MLCLQKFMIKRCQYLTELQKVICDTSVQPMLDVLETYVTHCYHHATDAADIIPTQIPGALMRVTKLICYLNPLAPRLESH